MTDADVLIVGAGPTGLSVANILARDGLNFRLIEDDTGPIAQSRAVWVHARTLELWDKLGLTPKAKADGHVVREIQLVIDGHVRGQLPYEGDRISSQPYGLIFEQNKAQRLLIGELERLGQAVSWSTRLLDFKDEGTHVVVTLQLPDGSQETVRTKYLVGADGAKSQIRKGLGLEFDGKTYESSLFLADMVIESPLDHEGIKLVMTREHVFAFFPMKGEGHYRVVGGIHPDYAHKLGLGEGIASTHEFGAKEVAEILNTYSGIKIKLLSAEWATIYRIHARMVKNYQKGNVFLAGDAAHIHSPGGGQGMNTGIGDAFNLGWKLSSVLRGFAKPELLASYELERVPVAEEVLNKSDKLFDLQLTTNPALQQLRVWLMPWAASAFSKFGREWLFSFLSQITVAYRKSPVVAEYPRIRDTARTVQAGDRAPHALFAENQKSIHDLLKGTGHHLLLFEGTKRWAEFETFSKELAQLCNRYAVPMDFHLIDRGEHNFNQAYFVHEPTLFLIRPDGYIAYRGEADLPPFEDYLDSLYLPHQELVEGVGA